MSVLRCNIKSLTQTDNLGVGTARVKTKLNERSHACSVVFVSVVLLILSRFIFVLYCDIVVPILSLLMI